MHIKIWQDVYQMILLHWNISQEIEYLKKKKTFVIGKKGCVLYINAYYPQIIMVLRWLNKDNVIKEYFLLY